jgi:hypothetical protein
MAQTKTVVTPHGEKITISPYANNGLTTNNGFIQLGGPLTQPSVLTTTSAFTLAINGLEAGSASDNVLVTDASGVLKYVPRTSFGGGADNLGNHIATQDLEMSTKSILNIWNAYVKNEVQIKDRITSNTNYFGIYKNNGLFGIWNNLKNTNALTIEENTNNVGIGTTIPTNTLHIKANTDPVKIEGLAGSINNNDAPIVVTSDGTLKKGAFPTINIVPNDVGTVIAINGKLEVAQEITVLMDADFNFAATSGNTIPIGNFKKIIIDNKNKYTANTTTNNFTVEASGTYQLTMNVLLHLNGSGEYFPVIGVWDNNTSLWTARVNDQYTATSTTNNMNKRLQTYTLITAVELTAGKPYSFRIANSSIGGTIIAFSYGNTGSGPASFASLKRLK